MRKRFFLAVVVLLACASGVATASTSSRAAGDTQAAARVAAARYLGSEIAAYQHSTWRWQRLMGLPPTQTEGRTLSEMSIDDIEGAVALWHRRAATVLARAQHPPHLAAWLCIHRYEGSWTDAGAPYYGGLQMDLSFQRHYGGRLLRSKGTANHWTPIEQIWVAEKARRSGLGFYPWPNTARDCGLI